MEQDKKFIFGKKMHEDHLFTYNLIFEDDNKEDRFYGISLKHELTVKEAEKVKEEIKNIAVPDSPFLKKPKYISIVKCKLTLIYDMGIEETLSEYKKELGGPIPLVETGVIMLSLLRGLDALHQADLPHLNLTPANILLGPNKQVWIVGIGVTSILKGMKVPATSNLCESLSPEILNGEEAGSCSDMFCLGKILFELGSEDSLAKGEFEQISIANGNFNSLQPSISINLIKLINGMTDIYSDSRFTAEGALNSNEMQDFASECKLSNFYTNPTSEAKLGNWSRIYTTKIESREAKVRLRTYHGTDVFLGSYGETEEYCVYCDQDVKDGDGDLNQFRGKYMDEKKAHRDIICFKIWTECLRMLASDRFFCNDCPEKENTVLTDSNIIDFNSRWFVCTHCNEKACIYCLEKERGTYHTGGEDIYEDDGLCDPFKFYFQHMDKKPEGYEITPEDRRKAVTAIMKTAMYINNKAIEVKKTADFAKIFTLLAEQFMGDFSYESIQEFNIDEDLLSVFPSKWSLRC